MGVGKTRVLVRMEMLVEAINEILRQIMAKLIDIQAKLTELEETTSKQTTVVGSAMSLLTGLTAIIASLRQELADAIASGDSTALQSVLDRLTEVETKTEQDKDALAAALVENTPAQNQG